jgi:hypothetical protein
VLLPTQCHYVHLARGAGHLVQLLPLVRLGGQVDLPERDLHLADAVRLADLVPVEDLQDDRLLDHISQWNLGRDAYYGVNLHHC